MDFVGRSPEHISDMSHPSPFVQNHPLNLLNNLTALGMSAQHLQNLPHSDVLEKLKMQVRDMKVGLMDPDFSSLHAAAANYGASMQNAAANFAQSMSQQHGNNPNGFSFQSPGNKDGNPASNSSASSEGSNSSQQNNGWSFEEQFKQVRQVSVILFNFFAKIFP
uniref:CSON004630 protein n=1 Tax=Culicoides sonorensis TaxID=179676 RepID=A0A336N1I7_CULSO